MTDALAILLNLVTLAESGKAEFDLEVSGTMFHPEHGAVKRVSVDGVEVCVCSAYEVLDAGVDHAILRLETLKHYGGWPEARERRARRRGFVE